EQRGARAECPDLIEHRHGITNDGQMFEIEAHRSQGATGGVDEMTAADVPRVSTALHERFGVAGCQIEYRNLRVFDDARGRDDGEQHSLAARQERWEVVLAFAARRVGLCQDGRFAASGRYAKQPG